MEKQFFIYIDNPGKILETLPHLVSMGHNWKDTLLTSRRENIWAAYLPIAIAVLKNVMAIESEISPSTR